MEIIRRENSWHRPLVYKGNAIGRICLHDGQRVLYTIQQGWLEHCYSLTDHYRTWDVLSIEIPVRTANKVNLAKKDNFIASYNDRDKGFSDKGKALYIYAPNLEKISELETESDGTMHKAEFFKLPITAIVQVLEKNPNPTSEKDNYVYVARPMTEIVLALNHSFWPTKEREELNAELEELNKKQPRHYQLSLSQLKRIKEFYKIA